MSPLLACLIRGAWFLWMCNIDDHRIDLSLSLLFSSRVNPASYLGPTRYRMLPRRSSLHRPLVAHVARHFSVSTVSRHVTRTLPPPEDEQTPAEASASSETAASSEPQLLEPAGSSSKHTSELKDRLRKWTDNTAIAVRGRADEFTSTTKTTLSQLGFHLNRMTGYEEIEALKRRVAEQGVYVLARRAFLQTTYECYFFFQKRV